MKFDRAKDVEQCANSIKMNAAKIANQFRYSRCIDITIHIEANEPPIILLNHKFYPEEYVEGMKKHE